MVPYKLVFKTSVEKDLRKFPPAVVSAILERISQLPADPFPRGSLKLTAAERLYRFRYRDYRVVYEVDEERHEVVIHYIDVAKTPIETCSTISPRLRRPCGDGVLQLGGGCRE